MNSELIKILAKAMLEDDKTYEKISNLFTEVEMLLPVYGFEDTNSYAIKRIFLITNGFVADNSYLRSHNYIKFLTTIVQENMDYVELYRAISDIFHDVPF